MSEQQKNTLQGAMERVLAQMTKGGNCICSFEWEGANCVRVSVYQRQNCLTSFVIILPEKSSSVSPSATT